MKVEAVSRGTSHGIGKATEDAIRLVAGLGVDGDVHAGEKIKHRSRVRKNPDEPNLRQVHLIHRELHDELAGQGFDVSPGQMGENVTTSGVDLLGLPSGARLRLGAEAVVEVTGLRNPCSQLDGIAPGVYEVKVDTATLPANARIVFEADGSADGTQRVSVVAGADVAGINFGIAEAVDHLPFTGPGLVVLKWVAMAALAASAIFWRSYRRRMS